MYSTTAHPQYIGKLNAILECSEYFITPLLVIINFKLAFLQNYYGACDTQSCVAGKNVVDMFH